MYTDMLHSALFRDASSKPSRDALLALYEASWLAFPGEAVLDEARAFAAESLLRQSGERLHLLPLRRTAPRLHAERLLQRISNQQQQRRRIDDDTAMDPSVLELARLDFNLVQALHRGEAAEMARWWKASGLAEKLPFARDRVVECFFCAACIAPEPRQRDCREALAKVASLVVHLDDIFDVYGTLDELAAFTDAVGRWDDDGDIVSSAAAAAAALPEYMKAMYSAIRETSVTAADRVLDKHGCHVLPLYKKAWHDLCKAFLVEARWHHLGCRPSFDEYLGNGWVTSSGPLLLLHAFPTLHHHRHHEQGDTSSVAYPRLVELSSKIFRLCNDCATHKAEAQRGDAPSSIACCMADTGASEEDARAAVQDAISETWKELNKELAAAGRWNPCSAESAANLCVNLARVIHCIYQHGDGITSPADTDVKQMVEDLLFNPIL